MDEEQLASEMTLYGELIASQMALDRRVESAERALRTSMDEGVLREQLLAVVGHDLRSPLQAAGVAGPDAQRAALAAGAGARYSVVVSNSA